MAVGVYGVREMKMVIRKWAERGGVEAGSGGGRVGCAGDEAAASRKLSRQTSDSLPCPQRTCHVLHRLRRTKETDTPCWPNHAHKTISHGMTRAHESKV